MVTANLPTRHPFVPPPLVSATDAFDMEMAIAWLRGEFAAANAIIDCLLKHIAESMNDGVELEKVVAAIVRRRENWIPVICGQKFFPIDEIIFELQNVVEGRKIEFMEEEEKAEGSEIVGELVGVDEEETEVLLSVKSTDPINSSSGDANGSSSSSSDGNEGSSQEEHSTVENIHIGSDDNVQICSDHDDCGSRSERIKTCKGFMAKEKVKGRMVNVVKGLKMYEDIFLESELSRLAEFINELRAAGRNQELSGETFILFNKQLKGNKKEMIQLGAPIFQSAKEETSHIEPIPPILLHLVDHLCQWRLIPESRKPNSCIIYFFDEGEYSQPYFKPPHVDNPISTLFLQETTMAFGRILSGDHDGNYQGSFTLPIKEGSLVVMRGNSADMARHVVCPSPNSRVCITFLRVRPTRNNIDQSPTTTSQLTTAMTLWKDESSIPQPLGYVPHAMSPTWGMALQAPLVFAPPAPMVVNPTRKTNCNNGTGVFLPWTVDSRKYIKHLPPRIQRRRMKSLALLPPLNMRVENASHISCIAV